MIGDSVGRNTSVTGGGITRCRSTRRYRSTRVVVFERRNRY